MGQPQWMPQPSQWPQQEWQGVDQQPPHMQWQMAPPLPVVPPAQPQQPPQQQVPQPQSQHAENQIHKTMLELNAGFAEKKDESAAAGGPQALSRTGKASMNEKDPNIARPGKPITDERDKKAE